MDYDEQVLVAGFKSWFGGILCLDWSPDGRYIVTGGEVRVYPYTDLGSSFASIYPRGLTPRADGKESTSSVRWCRLVLLLCTETKAGSSRTRAGLRF